MLEKTTQRLLHTKFAKPLQTLVNECNTMTLKEEKQFHKKIFSLPIMRANRIIECQYLYYKKSNDCYLEFMILQIGQEYNIQYRFQYKSGHVEGQCDQEKIFEMIENFDVVDESDKKQFIEFIDYLVKNGGRHWTYA